MSTESVKFVRRYTEARQTPLGPAQFSYEIYKSDTAEAARQFLEHHNVGEPQHYVVVETPEGNWAKDIQGMYKED